MQIVYRPARPECPFLLTSATSRTAVPSTPSTATALRRHRPEDARSRRVRISKKVGTGLRRPRGKVEDDQDGDGYWPERRRQHRSWAEAVCGWSYEPRLWYWSVRRLGGIPLPATEAASCSDCAPPPPSLLWTMLDSCHHPRLLSTPAAAAALTCALLLLLLRIIYLWYRWRVDIFNVRSKCGSRFPW